MNENREYFHHAPPFPPGDVRWPSLAICFFFSVQATSPVVVVWLFAEAAWDPSPCTFCSSYFAVQSHHEINYTWIRWVLPFAGVLGVCYWFSQQANDAHGLGVGIRWLILDFASGGLWFISAVVLRFALNVLFSTVTVFWLNANRYFFRWPAWRQHLLFRHCYLFFFYL